MQFTGTRPARWLVRLWLGAVAVAALAAAPSPETTIPVGIDAYRRWADWPLLRTGVRAYMRSTYDRAGGNQRADASHYLYQLSEHRNVTLDVTGTGYLCFARYNHWHGSPWLYEVDGREHLVQETSTADPLNPAPNARFEPAVAFPSPLTATWSLTKGADLSWVPIGFEKSFRMMYGRTYYGTGYYIYNLVDPAAPLSQPIRSWHEESPDAEVLALISRAGGELVPAVDSEAGRAMGLREAHGLTQIGPGVTLLTTLETSSPRLVRAIQLSAPRATALALGQVRLRVTWDDASTPSIDAPLTLFHGTGTFYNRDDREFLVKAFPVNVRFDAERVDLACYFPMPFARSARVELVNDGEQPIKDVRWSIRSAPTNVPMEAMGYFHATHRDFPTPVVGEDLVLLDTRQTEGGGDWTGHFVGTAFIFTRRNALTTLEGDPRFFFDDSQTPQAYGTGTEEWAGGGDYWGGLNMTLPFAGHPCGARKAEEAKDPEDMVHAAYRFLLGDLMPFGRNAVIRLEHGGMNEAREHYSTVTFWYGRRGATLLKTDALQPGDEASERAHDYTSPTAGKPYPLQSRYEWGPDTIEGKEVYPPHWELARTMTGTSEFTLALDPANLGVLLRRKLDYAFPNQRAEISIAPITNGKVGEFSNAGVWYLAGSNTCLFSNVAHELAPSQHVVQTSNRRFRDDEFLVSRALTAGHARVRVRVKFTPVEIPLLPGRPLPELAWSEIRYDAYCVLPPR